MVRSTIPSQAERGVLDGIYGFFLGVFLIFSGEVWSFVMPGMFFVRTFCKRLGFSFTFPFNEASSSFVCPHVREEPLSCRGVYTRP